MNIKDMVAESHGRAVAHGWWETPEDRSFAVKLAVVHSEVSEAFEEYRHGRMDTYFVGSYPTDPAEWLAFASKGNKPEGFAIEIADILIRAFDLAGAMDIDLEEAIRLKSAYNETRPYRHGGLVV
jgi:NTP pyrophosphatase (non-canonical NTP hydrolase)